MKDGIKESAYTTSSTKIKTKKAIILLVCLLAVIIFAIFLGISHSNTADAIAEPSRPTITKTGSNTYTIKAYKNSNGHTLKSLRWGVSGISSMVCITNAKNNNKFSGSLSPKTSSSYSFTIAESVLKNPKYACVYALYKPSNSNTPKSYTNYISLSSAQTDTTPPVIRISYSSSARTYTATATGGPVSSSWKHIALSSTSACKASAFQGHPGGTSIKYGNKYTAKSSDNGKYICFAVRDAAHNWRYVAHGVAIKVASVDTTPPVIKVSVHPATKRQTASATGNPVASSWRHTIVTRSASCKGTAFAGYIGGVVGSSGNVYAPKSSDNGKYICFTVKDAANNWAYKANLITITSAQTDTTPPVISIAKESDNKTYTAFADGIKSSTWKYVTSSSSSCTSTNFARGSVKGNQYTAKSSDSGKYICFAVQKTSNNLWGYKSRRIDTITSAQTDTTPPVISIAKESDNKTYTAFADGIKSSTWKYVTSSSSSCTSTNFARGSVKGNQYTAKSSDSGKYICFAVQKTSNNLWGYKSRRIDTITSAQTDTTPPVISIAKESDNKTYTAFADGIKSSTWKYVTSSSSSCTSTNFARGSVKGNQYTAKSSDSGKYICFAVQKTSNNLWGYKSRRIDTITSAQTDTTPPVITIRYIPSSNTYFTSSSSSDVDNSTWQYTILRPQAYCSKSTFSGSSGVKSRTYTAKAGDNGRIVCFKVSDKFGNWAFKASSNVIKAASVDTTPPVIRISYSSSARTYTATATGGPVSSSWKHIALSSTSACKASAFQGHPGGTSIKYGNKYTAKSSDNGKYICFAVRDAAHNWRYVAHGVAIKVASVDTTPPVISITPSGMTYTATATGNPVASSWRHTIVTRSASCKGTAFGGYGSSVVGSSGEVYVAKNSDDGKYICFTVKDAANNWAYKSLAIYKTGQGVEFTADPTVDITYSSSDGHITRVYTATSTGSVKSNTWKYVILNSASSCKASAFQGAAAKTGNKATVTSSSNNKYICFTVQTSTNKSIFGSKLVSGINLPSPTDATLPTISFTLNTSEICPPGYKHLNVNNVDQCRKSGEISTQYPISAWQDYRSVHGDVAGFLLIEASDASGIKPGSFKRTAFLSNDPGDCQNVSYDTVITGNSISVSFTNADDDKYICTTVQDDSTQHNTAYAKYQLQLDTPQSGEAIQVTQEEDDTPQGLRNENADDNNGNGNNNDNTADDNNGNNNGNGNNDGNNNGAENENTVRGQDQNTITNNPLQPTTDNGITGRNQNVLNEEPNSEELGSRAISIDRTNLNDGGISFSAIVSERITNGYEDVSDEYTWRNVIVSSDAACGSGLFKGEAGEDGQIRNINKSALDSYNHQKKICYQALASNDGQDMYTSTIINPQQLPGTGFIAGSDTLITILGIISLIGLTMIAHKTITDRRQMSISA